MGPCLDAKVMFLSSNRTQSRVVTDLLSRHNTLRRHLHNRTQTRVITGLLTRHNTLRRHLRLMGLSDSPLCRRCGAECETSVHILCECEALASIRHAKLGSFFLEPEDIKSISLGAIWNFSKVTGLHESIRGTKGPLIKA